VPGRCLYERPCDRHRAPQRGCVHRLPVLHLELLLRRAAVQPGARRGREVRHVPRPAVGGTEPGLRERLPRGRHPDRDREDGGLACRGRGVFDRLGGRCAGRRSQSVDDARDAARAAAERASGG
jgi:hypothetical protein